MRTRVRAGAATCERVHVDLVQHHQSALRKALAQLVEAHVVVGFLRAPPRMGESKGPGGGAAPLQAHKASKIATSSISEHLSRHHGVAHRSLTDLCHTPKNERAGSEIGRAHVRQFESLHALDHLDVFRFAGDARALEHWVLRAVGSRPTHR